MAFMIAKHDVPHAIGLLLCAVMAAAGFWLRRRSTDPDMATVSRILLGAAMLTTAIVCCNHIYLQYDRDPRVNEERGEFRLRLNTRHWPMIARRYSMPLGRSVPIVLTTAVFVWWLWRREAIGGRVNASVLGSFSILLVGLILMFGYGGDLLSDPLHFDMFRFGMSKFSSETDLLNHYVHYQPFLGTFNRHYPPGMMLCMLLEQRHLVRGTLAAINICVTAATVIAIARLVRELGGQPTQERWAIGLFAICAGTLIYPSITPTTFLTLLAATSTLLFVTAVKRNSVPFAAACGFSIAVYFFFSFQAAMLCIFLAVLTVHLAAKGSVSMRALFRSGAAAVVAFCAFFICLRVSTGFDIVKCFLVSTNDLRRSNGPYFDSLFGYLLRVSGNILAFMMSLGFVLAVPVFWGLMESDSNALRQSFIRAGAATILLAGAAGMGRMETERVWLPMVSLLAVASALCYGRWKASSRLFLVILVSAAVIACSQGILLRLGAT